MTSEEIYSEVYLKGLEDAWEMARKIVISPSDGGMNIDDLVQCFGELSYSRLFRSPASEVKEKYDAWKNKKDAVHVGDLIHTNRSDRDMVVTGILGSTPTYNAVDIRDGTSTLLLRYEFVTTGKHYDLPWVTEQEQEKHDA